MNRIGTYLLTLMLLLAGSYPAMAGDVYQHQDVNAAASTMGASTTTASTTSKRMVAATLEEYRLAAGDKIKIHVFGEEDLDVEVRLGANGDIRYPFLGKVHVAGMTVPQLERKITRDLANGYLIDPQVRVSMEEFRPFYVNGEVQKPGGYPYQPGLSVRKAISLAGGFTEVADEDKVFLILAGDDSRQEHRISLDTKMSPGDIVTVKQSFFFVNGEVEKPGQYPFQKSMTYRMAISMAGGMKERADEDKVYVIHESQDRQTYHVSDLDQGVNPGDVITIKQSFF